MKNYKTNVSFLQINLHYKKSKISCISDKINFLIYMNLYVSNTIETTYHCANEPHQECKKKIKGNEKTKESSDVRHSAVVSRSCNQVLTEDDIRRSCHAMMGK